MIARLDVKKKIDLLGILLDEFCGDAFISFEGDLSQADLRDISVVSQEPTSTLKRNTRSPQQDFLIIPITEHTKAIIKRHILPRIGLRYRVEHIQIEKNGVLVFGSYDNFFEGLVWVELGADEAFFDSLVEKGILHRYEVVTKEE